MFGKRKHVHKKGLNSKAIGRKEQKREKKELLITKRIKSKEKELVAN
jgi:hypothetical protein